MKKATKLILAAIAVMTLAAPAMATSFWSETFSYPDGNLAISPAVSGGLWTSHSGTTGNDIQVVSGVAVVDMTQRYDDNRTFPAQSATARTYACFSVMIPQPALSATTDYFALLKDSGTFNFTARTAVIASGTSNFVFGIGSTSSTFTSWPTPLNYGQWYTVAIVYDAATGVASLWVDPLTEASPSVSGAVGVMGDLISAFALRQGSANWKANVDNIQVGSTFSDLCPNPTGAATTTWGKLKTLYR